MDISKAIAKISGVSLLACLIIWAVNTMFQPASVNTNTAGELMAKAVTPWWVDVMNWLGGLPFAGILIFCFILFLWYTGAFNK